MLVYWSILLSYWKHTNLKSMKGREMSTEDTCSMWMITSKVLFRNKMHVFIPWIARHIFRLLKETEMKNILWSVANLIIWLIAFSDGDIYKSKNAHEVKRVIRDWETGAIEVKMVKIRAKMVKIVHVKHQHTSRFSGSTFNECNRNSWGSSEGWWFRLWAAAIMVVSTKKGNAHQLNRHSYCEWTRYLRSKHMKTKRASACYHWKFSICL